MGCETEGVINSRRHGLFLSVILAPRSSRNASSAKFITRNYSNADKDQAETLSTLGKTGIQSPFHLYFHPTIL